MKKPIRPPRLADRLFEWYCNRAAVEDLHGDLEELFFLNLQRMPIWKARLFYWRSVLSMMFSYALKKRKRKAAYHHFSTNNSLTMLANYFKVATRSLAKQRFFTTINVLGMSIGMSFSLLFIALISFLRLYDTFHVNNDRIYRVNSMIDDRVRNNEYASSPMALGEKIKHEYSGVEEVVRVSTAFSAEAKYETLEIPLRGYFADPAFLEVFTFPLIKGNKSTALSKPNSILITEKAAVKMFNEQEPIGKIITLGGFGDFEVTGVLKDIPKYSHMQFEIVSPYIAWETYRKNSEQQETRSPWEEFRGNYVYMLLPEGHDTEALTDYLTSVSREVYTGNEKFSAEFQLQALNDIAPGKELYNEIGPDWGYASLSIFGFLTLLILLPACFNYANISISRSLKRAKEIGLRKTVGGQSNQIFTQFIVETVLITLCSLFLAYGIFLLVKPEFMAMLVSAEGLDLDPDAITIICFVLFAIVVGVGAGAVPALYFSRMNPIQALKSKAPAKGVARISFRKILITGQFALSLGFIMAVVIVLKQYRSSVNYDFGFNQANILDVDLKGVDPLLFRNEFSKLSSVESVSLSSHVIGTQGSSSIWLKSVQQSDSLEVFYAAIDHNFLPNLNIEVVAGKNFGENLPDNGKYIIVNEEFVRQFKLGTPVDAINRTVVLSDSAEVIIAGVVKNFHYMHLREPVRSFFFQYDAKQLHYANLKIHSSDMLSTFNDLEATWKVLAGDLKFEAQFFDDEIEEAYSVYFVMVKICGFLGMLAISISCLGLLGMVVYTAETRTKEIGIRKVMGASSFQLAIMLSKGYVRLMLIAAMIAIPITYVFFDKGLLNSSYYRVEIGVVEILISLMIMLVLGLATVLSQTIKASRSNPVDTLRYE